jgi:hypothetical protein
MTLLRLEAVRGTALEAALALVAQAKLARTPDGRFAEIAPGEVDAFVRALAFAGIAAAPTSGELAPPSAAHAAVGRDLAPLPGFALELDLVSVRRLSLGEATRESLARRWPSLRSPSRAQRERCRSLLRGDDVAFAWTRRAWGSRSSLRARTARASLRPVIFDVAALASVADERRTFARDALLGRWLF